MNRQTTRWSPSWRRGVTWYFNDVVRKLRWLVLIHCHVQITAHTFRVRLNARARSLCSSVGSALLIYYHDVGVQRGRVRKNIIRSDYRDSGIICHLLATGKMRVAESFRAESVVEIKHCESRATALRTFSDTGRYSLSDTVGTYPFYLSRAILIARRTSARRGYVFASSLRFTETVKILRGRQANFAKSSKRKRIVFARCWKARRKRKTDGRTRVTNNFKDANKGKYKELK